MKSTSVFFAISLACFSVACASASQEDGNKPVPSTAPEIAAKAGILGNSWRVEKIGEKRVIDGVKTFILFETAKKVTGGGGVNRFFGSCKIEGDQLSFGPQGSTRRGGPKPNMDQEQRFHEALQKVSSFKIDENDLLHFFDADGNEILRMSRMAEK